MKEKIGKVLMDFSFYKGKDLYSDGDIENELLEIVSTTDNYEEVIARDNRWPILYHLSKQRQNIIEWYPISNSETVLEIGAGCGAITGVLCEKASSVTAVELSKKRSLINATRNNSKENLEIIVGDLNEIQFTKKYDIITLIGVLEYAPSFNNSMEPFHDFLKKIKLLLKPEGKLFIAIENKFGLKYWAGAREDHTGEFFDSIQGYKTTNKVGTFSKKEMTVLLSEVGFTNTTFYYPIPDYKLPLQIFSDSQLPKVGELRELIHNFDQPRLHLFDESTVYDQLIKNDEFSFFANSFLVICEL